MKLLLVCLSLCVAVAMARNCHEHVQAVYEQGVMPGTFIPRCEDDGTYSAVQCRGSVCECHSAEGQRIRGYGGHIAEQHKMTCNCARAVHELNGLIGITHSCDPLGNFEAIQCRGSMCYCADEQGEQLFEVEAVGIWELEKLDGKC